MDMTPIKALWNTGLNNSKTRLDFPGALRAVSWPSNKSEAQFYWWGYSLPFYALRTFFMPTRCGKPYNFLELISFSIFSAHAGISS